MVTQSRQTLCNPMNCIALQVPLSMGILQARILEWVAMPSSRRPSQLRDRTQVSHIAGGFFTVWVSGLPEKPHRISRCRHKLHMDILQIQHVLNSLPNIPILPSTCILSSSFLFWLISSPSHQVPKSENFAFLVLPSHITCILYAFILQCHSPTLLPTIILFTSPYPGLVKLPKGVREKNFIFLIISS